MLEKELHDFILHSNLIENVSDPDEILNGLRAWRYLSEIDELSLEAVLYTHYYTMVDLNPEIAGRMRDCKVWVGNRECPPPDEIFDMIDEWVLVWKDGVENEEESKLAHIQFEHIHPFVDGNGRTGRLIWLWHRENLGLPFKMIKFEERFKYYDWFKEE